MDDVVRVAALKAAGCTWERSAADFLVLSTPQSRAILAGSLHPELGSDERWWFIIEGGCAAEHEADLAAEQKERADRERVRDAAPALLEIARAYEKWEADLVMNSACWNTSDGLPKLTQEQYDGLMELQAQRNAALRAAATGSAGE